MRELMGKQIRALEQFGVEKERFRCPIVTGFVMFHAVLRYTVAERQQKIVAAVVACSKERPSFRDQLAQVLHFYRRCIECGWPVGRHMRGVRWLLAWREIDVAQVSAGNHRRIDD